MACESYGTQGKISDDGQEIIERTPIPLVEQARRYGSYAQAEESIENNRLAVINSSHISASVKQQIDSDLTRNREQLKCWAQACSNNASSPACLL